MKQLTSACMLMLVVLVLCSLILLPTSPTEAGGLSLYEIATADVGLASAGWAARAQDPSTLFKNPAGMSLLEGNQFQGGAQLLHGLGFAGVLTEIGLPREQFVPALLSFNVGVELGQLAVIALAYLAVASWARSRPWYRPRLVVPASAMIAAVGVFWTVQRVLAP